ncbi:hypothetical protein ACQJBY_027993 [Aegilops geniculata]
MDGWGAPVPATVAPDPHPPARWRPAASGSTACSRSGAAHRTTPEVATAVAVDDGASPAGPRCPRHASVVGDLACRHCRRLAGWIDGRPRCWCLQPYITARADGRWMPAWIRRLRPRHPQGGVATITYPTMGQQQFMISQVFVDLQAGLRAGLAGPIQHGAECMLKLFIHQAPPRRLRPPRRCPRLRQSPLLHEVICLLEFGRGR